MNNSNLRKSYKNLKVLVTGSTGFKGSWLCYWLNQIDSRVIGVGLRPEKDSIDHKKKIETITCLKGKLTIFLNKKKKLRGKCMPWWSI